MKFTEHQVVSLTNAVPAEGLLEGAIGTIVHMYGNDACEVEFISPTEAKVVILLPNQLKGQDHKDES